LRAGLPPTATSATVSMQHSNTLLLPTLILSSYCLLTPSLLRKRLCFPANDLDGHWTAILAFDGPEHTCKRPTPYQLCVCLIIIPHAPVIGSTRIRQEHHKPQDGLGCVVMQWVVDAKKHQGMKGNLVLHLTQLLPSAVVCQAQEKTNE